MSDRGKHPRARDSRIGPVVGAVSRMTVSTKRSSVRRVLADVFVDCFACELAEGDAFAFGLFAGAFV